MCENCCWTSWQNEVKRKKDNKNDIDIITLHEELMEDDLCWKCGNIPTLYMSLYIIQLIVGQSYGGSGLMVCFSHY